MSMRDGKTIATIEARMTSSRLPGKVLMPALGKPMLELMVERLNRAEMLDQIVIATTTNDDDLPIVALAEKLGVGSYRGSEDDVLSRVLEAAEAFDADVIVEMTGDCPLIDPAIVDRCVREYRDSDVDYVSNSLHLTYPIGMATQVFSRQILEDVSSRTDDPVDREHVSLYIYRNPDRYTLRNVEAPPSHGRPDVHVTLDEIDDYRLIRCIFEELYPRDPEFGVEAILSLLDRKPSLLEINSAVLRKQV